MSEHTPTDVRPDGTGGADDDGTVAGTPEDGQPGRDQRATEALAAPAEAHGKVAESAVPDGAAMPALSEPPVPPEPAPAEEGVAGSTEGATGGDDRQQPVFREALLESIGGWRGMLDSGLPVVVFVVANVVGGLRAAIWSAVVAAAVLTVVRVARRQSVQQAVGGFVGVALAAFIAARTGQAKGYFLLGIWASFVYAGVFLLSVLVRWPAVGLIWEYVDNGTSAWRSDRALMRVYTWTSLVWTGVFLARGLVQRFLYNEDRTGWLAVARLAMGYPLTLAALAVTLLAVRHVRPRRRLVAQEDSP